MTQVNSDAPTTRATFERELERYTLELRAYCYRMLGSAADAEDATQDALVRAWRHLDRFEGRSSMRSWLYRIATNVCLDLLARRQRRALPVDLVEPGGPDDALGAELPGHTWIEPMPDALVVPPGDPAEQAVVRDSVRLALVAALQVLPPRQRAALILREVLAWRPAEIATLLDTTVVSVNSALQRARQTIAAMDTGSAHTPADAVAPELLRRYVDAMERTDVDALVAILHEDATLTMPPFELWFRGRDAIAGWVRRRQCGDTTYLPVAVNGSAGFAVYKRSPDGQGSEAVGVQVVEVVDGAIAGVHTFLDERLVTHYGLPISA